jgi:hypothetical protein
MEYRAAADIDAPPAAIWAVLVDAPGYASWDSGLERIEGTIASGERIKLYPELKPGRAFPVRVDDFEPEERMTWIGGMPLGLFKGVRTFKLSPGRDGSTRFEMDERFSGPLLPLVGRSLPDFGPSFEQFARGLKERAERVSGSR